MDDATSVWGDFALEGSPRTRTSEASSGTGLAKAHYHSARVTGNPDVAQKSARRAVHGRTTSP